ncbi:MAG: hypothetical protein ACHQJ4_02605 [Ignavibacteria bacterium]
MKKLKLISLFSILLVTTFLFINGCGKSDKDVTKNEKKFGQETPDTSKFYTSPDKRFWQNYPGKVPGSDADMAEVSDAAQLQIIKTIIAGGSVLDAYTCEMHPQIHQNYMGTCPICKMPLKVQERKSNTDTSSQKPKKMN